MLHNNNNNVNNDNTSNYYYNNPARSAGRRGPAVAEEGKYGGCQCV